MQSIDQFIVRPRNSKRYNNTKSIGGIEFITNTSEEDHKFSNRYADVVQVPIDYTGPIKIGDTLIVHHNVFKFYNDMRGRRKSGKSFFKDDLFFVDDSQFYLYHDGCKWNTHSNFCFVKPIDAESSYIFKPFKNEPLMGEMVYPNKYLTSQGVTEGVKVSFKPESEYEFNIDGQLLYRIYDHHITLMINE